MTQDLAYPEEDSEDLKDSEMFSAVETTDSGHLSMEVNTFLLSPCTCGALMHPVTHALRRRKPDLFSRWVLECSQGHTASRLFKINWLRLP
jgi:hypothetical protein